MKRTLLALAMLLAAAAPAMAQADEEGCTDHPMFPRIATFHIGRCDSEEPSSFEFEKPGGTVKVEGHYWKIDYWLKDDARQLPPAQIGRNYWNLVAAKGGTKILERFDSNGGTLTASMPGPKGSGTIWLQVYVTMDGDGQAYSLTIVEQKPAR
jgi:hypothetical protein